MSKVDALFEDFRDKAEKKMLTVHWSSWLPDSLLREPSFGISACDNLADLEEIHVKIEKFKNDLRVTSVNNDSMSNRFDKEIMPILRNKMVQCLEKKIKLYEKESESPEKSLEKFKCYSQILILMSKTLRADNKVSDHRRNEKYEAAWLKSVQNLDVVINSESIAGIAPLVIKVLDKDLPNFRAEYEGDSLNIVKL